MISKHSARSTSLPVGFRTWLWRYTCLLWLISMLWHRQAIFESKGDKLSYSAECRIRTQGLRHLFASRLNACWQTDWAIDDQAKNLNSTTRPYDQQAFSPLDLTASWLSHLALAIYMFVVVNFDALAQTTDTASDFQIERRQVVFRCWMYACMHACIHIYTHTYIIYIYIFVNWNYNSRIVIIIPNIQSMHIKWV